jgi:hypothetical protein
VPAISLTAKANPLTRTERLDTTDRAFAHLFFNALPLFGIPLRLGSRFEKQSSLAPRAQVEYPFVALLSGDMAGRPEQAFSLCISFLNGLAVLIAKKHCHTVNMEST